MFQVITADENTPEGSYSLLGGEDGMGISRLETGTCPGQLACTLAPATIGFLFQVGGESRLEFSPMYSRPLSADRSMLLYNPNTGLNFSLHASPEARMVFLWLSVERVHTLFVRDAEMIPFLSRERMQHKFYDERSIRSGLLLVLNQLFGEPPLGRMARVYYYAKALEILGLYFSQMDPGTEACPVLNDVADLKKIKQAKEIILREMESPPTLKELSRAVGLNEFKLKAGFKEVYGKPVFQFLHDHKIEHSLTLLNTGQYHVNEVAYKVGYANPSHFIAAFRKKYGLTPKKYLQRNIG
jgi:AraC-like DNA-binding protein